MKIARIETPERDVLEGRYDEGVVETDVGTFDAATEEADLLVPCEPSALYCVGRNYGETVEQMGYEIPDEPSFFIKPPASMLAHGEPIEYPSWSGSSGCGPVPTTARRPPAGPSSRPNTASFTRPRNWPPTTRRWTT